MSIKFEDIGADRLDHGTMKYPTSTVIASSRGSRSVSSARSDARHLLGRQARPPIDRRRRVAAEGPKAPSPEGRG